MSLLDDDVVIALYPHSARDDDELNLNVNDEVTLLEKGEIGWWTGRLRDKEGLFPSSCVLIQHKDKNYRSVSITYRVRVTQYSGSNRIRTDWLEEGELQGKEGLFCVQILQL